MKQEYINIIDNSEGAKRGWAFISLMRLKEGYLTPDEVINLALEKNVSIDSPLVKIKRSTNIEEGVVIKNGTSIDGDNVSIGKQTVLDDARITGSRIRMGEGNVVSGLLTLNCVTLGNNNTVHNLTGINGIQDEESKQFKGKVVVGNYNTISNVKVSNTGGHEIKIGDHNILFPGLNINCSFPQGGRIRIGHYNSLGRDGGGVISTSYRFKQQWWGDVLVGCHVETTRGAEILGFSMLGWRVDNVEKARKIVVGGMVKELIQFFEEAWDTKLECELHTNDKDKDISFFGVVKAKRCCLTGQVVAKDDTRIQSAFMQNITVPERTNIFFSDIDMRTEKRFEFRLQDCTIENAIVTKEEQLPKEPSKPKTSGYHADEGTYDWKAISRKQVECLEDLDDNT